MKKSLITLLVTGLLAANAQAAGQDNTWYGGAKLGWSHFYRIDESNALNLDRDTKDAFGAGVFGGYQINQNLGLELGYDYLGKYEFDAIEKATGDAFRDSLKAQLAQLTLKLGFPVTQQLDLYGRVGGGYGWADNSDEGSDSRFVFVGALGAEYAFNRDWAARLEYQYSTPYGSRDDTGLRMDNGLLSLGAVYRFGQVAPVVAAPAPVPAPAPEPVIVEKQFTLSSDVLFAFGKATLKPEAVEALNTLYSQIEEARPREGMATVIGHTDRIGSDAFNQRLSEQRAQTVADYLVSKGIPASKINVEGRGRSSPVTGDSCVNKPRNELIVCLAPDRRVEVNVQGVTEVKQ